MKWFKRVLFAVLGTSIVLGGLGLYLNYVENNTFLGSDSIDGISLGQSREELLFSDGLNLVCSDYTVLPQDCDSFTLRTQYHSSLALAKEEAPDKIVDTGVVDLESDRVVRVMKVKSLPRLRIENTDDLTRRLGEPDIYSVSPDFSIRSYAYSDIKWSFQFEKNQLRRVELGKIRVGYALNLAYYLEETFKKPNDYRSYYVYNGAKIFLRGEQICPGTKCPFKDRDRIEDEILDAKELEELLLKRTE